MAWYCNGNCQKAHDECGLPDMRYVTPFILLEFFTAMVMLWFYPIKRQTMVHSDFQRQTRPHSNVQVLKERLEANGLDASTPIKEIADSSAITSIVVDYSFSKCRFSGQHTQCQLWAAVIELSGLVNNWLDRILFVLLGAVKIQSKDIGVGCECRVRWCLHGVCVITAEPLFIIFDKPCCILFGSGAFRRGAFSIIPTLFDKIGVWSSMSKTKSTVVSRFGDGNSWINIRYVKPSADAANSERIRSRLFHGLRHTGPWPCSSFFYFSTDKVNNAARRFFCGTEFADGPHSYVCWSFDAHSVLEIIRGFWKALSFCLCPIPSGWIRAIYL